MLPLLLRSLFRSLTVLVTCLVSNVVLSLTVCADDQDTHFFETRIRPLLVARCYECHSVQTEQNGRLSLDSKAGWAVGGDSGPAIVVGDPDASLVIKAVRWSDPALQMPPQDSGGKLTDAEIADLETWIRNNAFDPRVVTTAPQPRKSWAETFAARRTWWSLQPLQNVAIPDGPDADWNTNAVDRLLFLQMTDKGLAPAELAGPTTLIRRATLVLTGLPPTSSEVSEFVAACQIDRHKAYESLIDRLLNSSSFGERFARHWLDVVRFSETHGNEWNYDVPYAWRYRDYVIRAFNEDLPFDRFVQEHVAGDLIPNPRWNSEEKFNESVIGTAFYRFGEVNHDSCVLFGIIGYDVADNQVDTLTKSFQATTVACARCHDHKMDAVSTKDYHALLGVIRSSRSVQHTIDHPNVNQQPLSQLKELKVHIRSELARVWRDNTNEITTDKMIALAGAAGEVVPSITSPLRFWYQLKKSSANSPSTNMDDLHQNIWKQAAMDFGQETANNKALNAANYATIADFRNGDFAGWTSSGMGLRDGAGRSGDFSVSYEGELAVRNLLPAGAYSFALSDKMNGAIRSPTLKRTHGKISFEVMGGGSSFTRAVFNNCQLNYTNQHSIHHPDWTWVTVDFQDKTDQLFPYAEIGTFWDNPKFPDPLGTLGKDVENQRLPFKDHAKNPRTWWGVRRVVSHDVSETPKDEAVFLERLYQRESPNNVADAAQVYVQIARECIDAFAADRATDDEVRWLDWLVKSKLLNSRLDASARLSDLVERYRQIEIHQLSLPRTMPGLADEFEGFSQPILLRGEPTKPGEAVERRYLEALVDTCQASPDLHGSGRWEIAQAITSVDNPLTARVMVNRLWHWIFGQGLVQTPDDFGHLGELPSHPELLDHLAARFGEKDWSMKSMIRTLVLSRAFQLSSVPPERSRQIDPENISLSWYPARRAEAEIIRDAILAVSGRLDKTMFGPSIHPYREKADTEKRLYVGPLDGDGRRSIYIKFQLMEPAPFLSAFNLPGGKVTQGRRDTSNVPAQSLALLNDAFVVAMADKWATALVADGSTSIAERIQKMMFAALGRNPTLAEIQRFADTVHKLAQQDGVNQNEILTSQLLWKDAAHTVFNFKEFIFIP